VRVIGTVSEAFNNTQITPTSPTQICTTGNSVVATVVDLPEPINNDLERYENMRVVFPETLTVTGNFNYGRFGELVLSSDGRRFQQNSFDRPNTPGALARANLNLRNYVVLDDGKQSQNPNPIPYLSPDNTRRAGDTTTGLTGVLTFDFGEYRVQPTATVTFAQANPRPVGTPAVSGTLRVASSNVLNYFNGNGTNQDGAAGGFPTARGADNLNEFNRQRAKIISAITTLNPDVLGVIEMENDGFGPESALQDLVNGLNAATAPGTYAGIDSPNPGTDLIKNAIIYKPSAVTPVGAQVNDIDPAWNQARAPLAQTFQQNSSGERFTFIVNHFTSKGCSASDTGIDADAGDGQGCDNGQRQLQANRLLVFIQARKTASGDPDVLSMGDYNAYAEEDPMFILEQDSGDTLADGSGGLVSESKRFVPQAERYSFQFDEAFGELDHALATKSMNNQVSGTIIWHINADEPTVIDYNTEFKTQDLYAPTPYRSADHDPLLVGLSLTSAATAAPSAFLISEFRFRGPSVSATPDPTSAANNEFVEFYNNRDSDVTVSTTDGSAGWACVASDGQVRFIIPNNTVIPARGHFLAVNSTGYSLSAYPAAEGTTATGDQILLPDGVTLATGYTGDIPDAAGIAIFNTANTASFVADNRLDAVGYAAVGELYREGEGLPAGGVETTSNLEHSFYRDLCGYVAGVGCTTGGLPKDTNSNASDFLFVDAAAPSSGPLRRLGAPGPQNLSSPLNRNSSFAVPLLDQSKASTAAPNRVRKQCAQAEECNPNRSSLGTLSIRRRFVNQTSGPITRLRFRVMDTTTFPQPNPNPRALADVRAIPSGQVTGVVVNDSATCAAFGTPGASCTVTVEGTTLEEPPGQAFGGGYNATLSAGTITLATPLEAGESINIQLLLGVQVSGNFRFLVNIEALP
jgi:hypothetical protein